MTRIGQFLLVFGIFFLGLAAFDSVRHGAMAQPQKYMLVASGTAVVVGALLLAMKKGRTS